MLRLLALQQICRSNVRKPSISRLDDRLCIAALSPAAYVLTNTLYISPQVNGRYFDLRAMVGSLRALQAFTAQTLSASEFEVILSSADRTTVRKRRLIPSWRYSTCERYGTEPGPSRGVQRRHRPGPGAAEVVAILDDTCNLRQVSRGSHALPCHGSAIGSSWCGPD